MVGKISARQRGFALAPLAALAVHQLRYLLAFGGGAGRELSAQGHAYLTSLTPGIILVASLAFGVFLARLARAWTEGESGAVQRQGGVRLWLVAATGLLAIYIGQEFLEGLFASGHPAGLIGVFGDGGWWSIPAAFFVGGLLAFALRGADAAVERVARARRRILAQRLPRPTRWVLRPATVLLPRLRPLARSLAERGPPLRLSLA